MERIWDKNSFKYLSGSSKHMRLKEKTPPSTFRYKSNKLGKGWSNFFETFTITYPWMLWNHCFR